MIKIHIDYRQTEIGSLNYLNKKISIMNTILQALILIVITLSFTGCTNTNPDEQTVPWGRPAEWESGSPFYGG